MQLEAAGDSTLVAAASQSSQPPVSTPKLLTSQSSQPPVTKPMLAVLAFPKVRD